MANIDDIATEQDLIDVLNEYLVTPRFPQIKGSDLNKMLTALLRLKLGSFYSLITISNDLVITHNLDTEYFIIQFANEAGIIVCDYEVVDSNSIKLISSVTIPDVRVTILRSGRGIGEEDGSGSGVSLGETSTTAYRGDRGKTAYDHSQLTTGNPHAVTKADVGLGNVDNTADSAKPVSAAQSTAINAKVANDLTASTTVAPSKTAINAALALKADAEDVINSIVAGSNISIDTTDPNNPIISASGGGGGGVELGETSITAYRGDRGKTAYDHSQLTTGNPHDVNKSDVGLGNVDNTADSAKPVSSAQQTALDSKAPLASPTFTGTVSGITKSMIGLSNVDNTADTAKPVSTAQSTAINAKVANDLTASTTVAPSKTAVNTALDLKAPLASPAFTGSPNLPAGTVGVTQTTGDSSTKLATTAFVDNSLNAAEIIFGSSFTGEGTEEDPIEVAGGGGGSGVSLGETSTTAYRGDRGKTAYDHSQLTTGNPHAVTKADVGLGNVDNTADSAKPVSAAQSTAINAKVANDLTASTTVAPSKTAVNTALASNLAEAKKETICVAVSDETTDITTGTAKVTFRMPFAMTLTGVRANLNTASSSGIPTFDINENGSTILSTKLTIDASEKTSTTAATVAVISDVNLADDSEITIDIDVAGTGAKGAKIYLIGSRT